MSILRENATVPPRTQSELTPYQTHQTDLTHLTHQTHQTLIVFRRMVVHLVDGTYELFRHFYAMPPARDKDGREVAAVRGVVGSLM